MPSGKRKRLGKVEKVRVLTKERKFLLIEPSKDQLLWRFYCAFVLRVWGPCGLQKSKVTCLVKK